MNLRKLTLVALLPVALTGCNEAIDTVKLRISAHRDRPFR